MRFEVALNVTWLLLGLLALAGTWRTVVLGSNRSGRRASTWLHVVGVGLIVAALFPYISATDDLVRIEQFSTRQPGNTGHHSSNDNLIRLYETLDSPIVGRTCEVILTFFFLSLVTATAIRVVSRVAPLTAGRSPPFPLS